MSLLPVLSACRFARLFSLWIGVSALQLSLEPQMNGAAAQSLGSLEAPIYDSMKMEFLDIDPQYFDEVVFSDHRDDTSQDFLGNSGNNVTESKINEGGFKGWQRFGGNYWCDNETHGTTSLCRYMTGGSPGNNQQTCGTSVNNDYQTALDNPDHLCSPGQWAPNSGSRLWVGASDNRTFILPFFQKVAEGPANRLCFEIELPEGRLRYSPGGNTSDNGDPGKAQVVNQGTLHENLEWTRFELGTYTSPYFSDQYPYTPDEEVGGTFQGGGTHFYHKPSSYGRYPLDKAYALNQNTIVMCFATAPSGVRSGMRPPYSYNPLMTVVGENGEGLTDAYSYVPYLARVYFDLLPGGADAQYPLTVKYNKVFAVYEQNDIQALGKDGAVLGVDMVEDGNPGLHPFTIYNSAAEDRSYRVIMMASGNLAMTSPSNHFRLYVDDNGNEQLDADETTELAPNQVVTLPAGEDLHLVAVQRPSWGSPYHTKERYGRQFAPAGITFQEVGRLRMTSYAVRTWLGTAQEVAQKETLLAQMVYPSPESDYATQAQWNQDKPDNLLLVRNTPDYLDALSKLQARRGTIPGPPNEDLPAGLVAYWPFDEGSGEFVHSEQDNLPAGLLVKGPVWVNGYRGTALQFAGRGAQVDLGKINILEEQPELTTCMWFKTAFQKNGMLLTQQASTVQLRTIRRNSTLQLHMAQGRRLRSTTPINDGQWHHVCGVFDGDQATLYVDGIVEEATDVRFSQTKSSRRAVIVGRTFHGEIDDVQVYQRALSLSEVAQLAQVQPD